MATVNITIPDDKLSRVVDALVGLYPIPQILSEEDETIMVPQYTENQWAKQCVLNFLKRSVARYEQSESRKAIVYNEDDTIAN